MTVASTLRPRPSALDLRGGLLHDGTFGSREEIVAWDSPTTVEAQTRHLDGHRPPGRDPFAHHGFVNPPVYRGSTVLFKSLESFEKREQRYIYGRRGTPSTEALEQVITRLEGGARTYWRRMGWQLSRPPCCLLPTPAITFWSRHRLWADPQIVRTRSQAPRRSRRRISTRPSARASQPHAAEYHDRRISRVPAHKPSR